VLLCDSEFGSLAKSAINLLPANSPTPVIIDIIDPEFSCEKQSLAGDGKLLYEDFIASGDSKISLYTPQDEWEAITLNYTSGCMEFILYNLLDSKLNCEKALREILKGSFFIIEELILTRLEML
jgi:DNA-binding NarL/FixJ family response regulator